MHRRRRRSRKWPFLVAFAGLFSAVATALLLSYPSHNSDPTFLNPHENVRWHLAQEWLEEGEPTHPLPAFSRLPPDIAPALTPRDAASTDGTVVPKDFPYAVVAVALVVGLAPAAATYLTGISALGVIALVALLAHELTGRRGAALLASAFVAVSAPFWSANAGLLETGGTTTMFFLAGLVTLCRARRLSSEGVHGALRLVVGGALLGTAVGFHHAAVLLVGAVVVSFSWRRLGGSLRQGLLISTGVVVAVLPLLAFNTWLYGSPFSTGYGVSASFYDATVQNNSGGLVALQPSLLLEQLWRYGARPEMLLILAAAAFGWVGLQRSSAPSTVRTLGLSALLGGVPYLVFTGARPLWGADTYQGNASFLRYCLPLFAVAATFAAGWIVTAGRRHRWAKVALAVVVLLGAVSTTATSPGNPGNRRQNIGRVSELRQELLAAIPPEALVVTARSDKLLWPQRSTLMAAFLAERQDDDGHLHDLVPTPERLTSVLVRLHERGEDVWLYDDNAWLSADPAALPTLDRQLLEHGVQRQWAGTDGLYRIRVAPMA